jgi:hypothetical protein
MRRGMIAAVGAVAVLAGLVGMPSVASAEDAPVDPGPATIADRIAEAAAGGAESPDDLARAAGLPAEGPASLRIADGMLSATVQFAAAPDESALARVRSLADVGRVYTVAPAVAVTVDPENLAALAEIDGVVSVAPDLEPSGATGALPAELAAVAAPAVAGTPCRAFPADGDDMIGGEDARARFGVDGTGVTVGVISDSYGLRTTVTTPQQDVAAGLLPGPGNPCGYETPVDVITEDPTARGKDEGRAMAQLVHGIAPGARLLFASGSGSSTGMAQAVEDLAAAGATVIVDDLGYGDEPYFQQGVISASIEKVRARGIAYYSAAGNDNKVGDEGSPSARRVISSWQTPAYRPIDCPSWVQHPTGFGAEYDCLDFDAAGGGDASDRVGFNGAVNPTFFLSWGEPMKGIASRFNLQLYDDAATPQLIASGTSVDDITPNAVTGTAQLQPAGTYRLVLVRDRTVPVLNTPAIWISTFGGAPGLAWRQHDRSVGVDVVGPSTYGHPADGSGVGVAASRWYDGIVPEVFSSIGPVTLLFAPYDPLSSTPAAPLPVPVRTSEPSITGLDGQRTSFFGQTTPPETVPRFYGTSAAAPTVAAVHALAAAYAPGLAADTVTTTMLATAREMVNPYPGAFLDEAVFGAGLADAGALLAALPLPAVDAVTATAVSASSVSAAWTDVPPAAGYAVELLRGDAVTASVQIAQGVGTATFADLLPDTEYRVRVTTLAEGGAAGGSTLSGVVRTPVPPQPAVVPAAPAESALMDADRGGLRADASSVVAGGTVTVTGLPADTWVHGWVFSTPVSLGWAWTGAAGAATFVVPADLPAGPHRIAVTDAAGTLLGWVDLTVTARGGSGSLAATGLGVDLTPASLAAAVATLGGALLLLMLRRRPSARHR